MDAYPQAHPERDAWVRKRRRPKAPLDASGTPGWLLEWERDPSGRQARGLTVFLVNRECPWRCVFCDLWKHTLDRVATASEIVAQLDGVLQRTEVRDAAPCQVKLYNAGSYFDAGAIPPAADAGIAARCRGFGRVIVESHPALIGDRCWAFRDRLTRGGGAGPVLEVALGLETVHEGVLERLNKRVSLAQFEATAEALRREGVEWRAFVLVQPPFQDPATSVEWAVRSARVAFEWGAGAVSLIAVRGGNGAMEELAGNGSWTPPGITELEAAMDASIALGMGRVFADVWDLGPLAPCAVCREARMARLERMNRTQTLEMRVDCPACGAPGA